VGQLQVAFHGGYGGGHDLVLEVDFVQIAGVTQLARQQLDLQVAVPQRQEIAGQRLGLGMGRRIQAAQGQFDHLPPVKLVPDQAGRFRCDALQISRGDLRLAHVRHYN